MNQKTPVRVSARKWLDAHDKIDRRRKAYEMQSFAIDHNAVPAPRTQEVADNLFDTLGLETAKGKVRICQQFFGQLVHAGILAHWHAGCVRYGRSTGAKPIKSPRYSGMLSAYVLNKTVQAAVDAGLFEETRSPKGAPSMTRLIPTESLTSHFDSDPDRLENGPEPGLVRLRTAKCSDDLPFDPGHPVAKRVALKLQRVNEVNNQSTIEAWIADAFREVHHRQLRPVHFAIFHDRFKQHGRIYTGKYGHQHLTKMERVTLTFDGEPSCELDFAGFHTRLLYHLEGIDYREDPYALWGDETKPAQRIIAKRLINAAINAEDRKGAVAACNEMLKPQTTPNQWKSDKEIREGRELARALKQSGLSFGRVYAMAEEAHEPIAHKFGTQAGRELMTLDAKLALDILSHFAGRCIPCLGLHDSFVVPAHCRAELREVMTRLYRERFGFDPVVK